VADKPVRQEHGADFAGLGEQVVAGGEMQNLGAKTANGAFFNCNENLMPADELPDESFVQGLGEPGVRHGDRKATGGQIIGCLQAFLQARAE